MPLERIPSVHELVERLAGAPTVADVPRSVLVDATRAVLEEQRRAALGAGGAADVPSSDALLETIADRIARAAAPPLPAAINATGIVVHTGLGRAPLPRAAVDAIGAVAGGYAPVELDLETGGRGRRSALVADLLCRLTGAESATVVNNNAGALLLVLATFAHGRTVAVSRGELIEIGGSFRLPDVMAAGGAVLREVGTTNRTRLGDYERAVDETTAVVLKVHPSNYRVEGFHREVGIEALAGLGRRHGVLVVHDIGSGVLRPPRHASFAASEPAASTSVAAGADLVLFSGDKLLGGPQAGIVVGRRALVETLEEQPMMRALRVGKLTLTALAATLRIHLDESWAMEHLPVFRLASAPLEALRRRGERVVEALRDLDGAGVTLEESRAYVGGGAVPAEALPSCAVVVRPAIGEDELLDRLRAGVPPVVGRARGGAVWLDLRAVAPEQDGALAAAVREAVGGGRQEGESRK